MIKKSLVVLALGLASMPAFAQQSLQIRTGPQTSSDAQYIPARSDKSGAIVVTGGHGTYQEAAYRGNIFTLASSSGTNNTLVVAAHASEGAMGTEVFLVGFYNPTSSGKAAVILDTKTTLVSGTPGGPLLYNYYCGLNITSASAGLIHSGILNNNIGASAMTPQNGVVLTATPAATPAMLLYGPVGGPAASATGAGIGSTQEDVQGKIIVPPGCLFGVNATATGTTHVLNAALTWEEIPYP